MAHTQQPSSPPSAEAGSGDSGSQPLVDASAAAPPDLSPAVVYLTSVDGSNADGNADDNGDVGEGPPGPAATTATAITTTTADAAAAGSGSGSASGSSTSVSAYLASRGIARDKREHFPSRFSSWDELHEYMSEFCRATYQPFRRRSSVSVAKRNRILASRSDTPALLPEEHEFYSKRYHCTHGGSAQVHRGAGRRSRAAVRHTGCMARMNATLKLDPWTNSYFIDAHVSDSHNHPIGREQYFSYSEHRQITDPALLRVVETMSARGEMGKTILARITEIMRETTGEKCLLTKKDIYNIAAKFRKAKQAGGNASGAHQDDDDAADEQGVKEAEDAGVSSDSDSDSGDGASRSKRRRVDGTNLTSVTDSAEDEIAAEPELAFQAKTKPGSKMKLSHLGVLLDASNCYNHIHSEIVRMGCATVDLLPGTISGFAHDIFKLPPLEKPDDLDFVLPQYVITGCVDGIIEYCHAQGLHPRQVGVKLTVHEPSLSTVTGAERVVTLSSRQLLLMTRFYLARRNVTDARRVLDWIISSTNLENWQVSAPFDEYVDYTKHLIVLSVGLMPFSNTVIAGISLALNNIPLRFTETIQGASILKFGGADSRLDIDCVKAALLAMHSRFHENTGFICPSFMLERQPADRCKQGSTYGAFLSPKQFVAGVVQLRSTRWGGVVLDRTKGICFLYSSDATDYAELQQVMSDLFLGYKVPPGINFSPPPPPSPSSVAPALLTQKNDSGILALLFVELMVQSKSWADILGIHSLDYFRARYMLQAIQVLTKQNVHDIRWD